MIFIKKIRLLDEVIIWKDPKTDWLKCIKNSERNESTCLYYKLQLEFLQLGNKFKLFNYLQGMTHLFICVCIKINEIKSIETAMYIMIIFFVCVTIIRLVDAREDIKSTPNSPRPNICIDISNDTLTVKKKIDQLIYTYQQVVLIIGILLKSLVLASSKKHLIHNVYISSYDVNIKTCPNETWYGRSKL